MAGQFTWLGCDEHHNLHQEFLLPMQLLCELAEFCNITLNGELHNTSVPTISTTRVTLFATESRTYIL